MKKIKKILSSISAIAFLPLLSSCNLDNNSTDKARELIDDPERLDAIFLENTVNSINLNFESFLTEPERKKEEVYFTSLHDTEKDVKFSLSGENSDKINAKIIAFLVDRDKENYTISNRTGKGKISFEFSLKSNQEIKYTKIFELSGFKTNPFNAGADGVIPNRINKEDDLSFLEKYANQLNQDERFELDNKEYSESLKFYLGQGEKFEINKFRPELKISDENLKEFDKIAAKAKINNYEDAAAKGFALPVYKENGEYDGISLYEGKEVGKQVSWVDAIQRDKYRINGLARYLVNQKYKDAALQTFHVGISNKVKPNSNEQITEYGTMWIMDFEKTNSPDSYPTKWYFGTNLHVADKITNNTSAFNMARLNPDAPLKTVFKLMSFDENFTNFSFPIDSQNPAIKMVFSGRDFLNTKPSDFLSDVQKEKYKDKEEFADFAVIEIDFSKIKFSVGDSSSSIRQGSNFVTDNYKEKFEASKLSELAKIVTNDYASNISKHIRFKNKSYLKDYSQIDFKLDSSKEYNGDSLYIVGYPSSYEDYFLDKVEDYKQYNERKGDFSLWTNSEESLFNRLNPSESDEAETNPRAKRGNYLSYQLGYRTITDKPGIVDEFLVAHKLNGLYKGPNNEELIAMGMAYLPRHYSPIGGSSGSSIRTQNNELIAVYHASNKEAKTGLAIAFRSEGYDYKGAFGSGANKYSLPQYDLIYGGGKDQKNSYRQALKEIYKNQNNFRTNLFPNGLDTIEEGFEFEK
ncbi:Ig-specific serine endopeptidase MIP [Mesomycoplasma molare]|uniref:DUF31 family protein n=1 Tax=Mesomycoplasma molare TaxID=171288 RepID=A0ABY5TTF9_9BACT|nr:DUF31 family protein [Mesomycoplasma molare]UWD33870.1 DUF31 family protein [Mesomycoplasma molare]